MYLFSLWLQLPNYCAKTAVTFMRSSPLPQLLLITWGGFELMQQLY